LLNNCIETYYYLHGTHEYEHYIITSLCKLMIKNAKENEHWS